MRERQAAHRSCFFAAGPSRRQGCSVPSRLRRYELSGSPVAPQAENRLSAGTASLRGRHSFEPFPRFVQLLEGPALDAGGSRRLDVADGELAEI
jgi:hypothetical protein